MTVEKKQWKNGSIASRVIACPACGKEFNHGAERKHHLLNEHDPSDFGLSELLE